MLDNATVDKQGIDVNRSLVLKENELRGDDATYDCHQCAFDMAFAAPSATETTYMTMNSSSVVVVVIGHELRVGVLLKVEQKGVFDEPAFQQIVSMQQRER